MCPKFETLRFAKLSDDEAEITKKPSLKVKDGISPVTIFKEKTKLFRS